MISTVFPSMDADSSSLLKFEFDDEQLNSYFADLQMRKASNILSRGLICFNGAFGKGSARNYSNKVGVLVGFPTALPRNAVSHQE